MRGLTSENGSTLLHWACRYNQSKKVLQGLFENYPGAFKQRNSDGWTPLHFAFSCNQSVPVIQWLLENYLGLFERMTKNGWTPLHVACRYNKSEKVIQWLLEKFQGAVNLTTTDGFTPLHLACKSTQSLQVIQWLLEKYHGALKLTTTDGWTPLHVACRYNQSKKVIELLLKEYPGAVKLQDNNRLTPLHLAYRYKVSKEVKYLLYEEYKKAAHLHNKDGETPLEICATLTNSEQDQMKPQQEQQLVRSELMKIIQGDRTEPLQLQSDYYVNTILTNEILGEGFFGVVYKGIDTELDCQFAVKKIHTAILRSGNEQEILNAKKTFKKEQETLSEFSHPNITSLYAFYMPDDSVDGNYFLIYELGEKGSLDHFWKDDLGRERLCSFQQRVRIAIEVFTAIQFLHNGINEIKACVHRDIKSANVVLKGDMTAQLIDCGLAKFVTEDNKNTRSTGVKGTVGYVCPRYAAGGIPFDKSCDIFSFGVLMTELWTGRLQNHEKDNKKVNFYYSYVEDEGQPMESDVDETLGFAADDLPTYASNFKELALQCMSSNNDKRPSGETIMDALRSIWSDLQESEDQDDGIQQAEEEKHDDSLHATPFLDDGTKCNTCRTFPVQNAGDKCPLCLIFIYQRAFMWGILLTLKPITAQLDGMIGFHSRQDVRLINPVPRLFLPLPAEPNNFREHPRSWFRDKVMKKYHLYFVCERSNQVIDFPIKLRATKAWVKQFAPALGASLMLLKIAINAVTGLSLSLGNVGATMLELTVDKVQQILDEVREILKDSAQNSTFLDCIRDGTPLADEDIHELNGGTYELVVEKAQEQRGWRSAMEPVRKMGDSSLRTYWVSKAVAENPQYGYAIINCR